MYIPTLEGFAVRELVTFEKLNRHTKDSLDVLFNPPFCKLQQTAGQSFASSSSSSNVIFNSVVEDNDGMADLSNGLVVIRTPGIYTITGQICWATNNSGWRHMYLSAGGTNHAGDTRHPAQGTQTRMNITIDGIRLSAGTHVYMMAAQNSGSALLTDAGRPGTWMSVRWVGK